MDVFSKRKRSEIMSKIRSKNTKAEKLIFGELRKRGIYFRKHYSRVTGKPDIALPRRKLAIFIDGDFWHGWKFEKTKRRLPKKYWLEKIKQNMARDKKNRAILKSEGWKVLRVWEHGVIRKKELTIDKIINFIRKYENF